MVPTLDEQIKELKEAMSKFIINNRTADFDQQAGEIVDRLESLLEENFFTLNEEDYINRYSSEDYYSSSC